MTKPPLEDAPTGWLRQVAVDLMGKADDHPVHTHIHSADDGETYVFTYVLADVREELRRRAN